MQFVNEVFEFFSSNEPSDLTDEEVKLEFHKRFKYELEQYIEYYDSFRPAIIEKYIDVIKRIMIVRIFGTEVWDKIYDNYDEVKHDHLKHRISAIGKIIHRVLLTTDENIALFRNGIGISILSNCRMIMESYAFAVYIFETGEIEADRFQDYSEVQKRMIQGKLGQEKCFGTKYEDEFYKNYGWITNREMRSISKLINRLQDITYIKYYKYLSNFVHASPFSINATFKLGGPEKKLEEHHFPLKFIETVNLNVRLLYDLIYKIIDYFLDDDDKRIYHVVLNALTKWS
jgi:hypothetical protein